MSYLLNGYLCDWEGGRHVRVHRKVWAAAHGPIPPGMIIHHVNGDRHDNRLENLSLVSRVGHPTLHRTLSTDTHRRCGMCKVWLTLDAFYPNQKRCKPCAAAAGRHRQRAE